MPSSRPPNPSVIILPVRFTVPKSESCMLSAPDAAQPPLLLNSSRRSSLTHTSPDLTEPEMLRTPIIIVFTSPSEGLPMMLTLLLGLSLSYSE